MVATNYRMAYAPNHPLASGSPYIPEHRMILWEKIGAGAHPCHHCSELVAWSPGGKTRKGALCVDHLDRNKHNNDPANLVPTCQRCNNLNKDCAVKDGETYRTRPNGTRLRGEQRTCRHCEAAFVAFPDPRPGRGLYCSRSCARAQKRSVA